MSDYNYELHAANDTCREMLRRQQKTARAEGIIECAGCGHRFNILLFAFRCLYCGQYFCALCGEEHFGKTRQQHLDERRRKIREALNK